MHIKNPFATFILHYPQVVGFYGLFLSLSALRAAAAPRVPVPSEPVSRVWDAFAFCIPVSALGETTAHLQQSQLAGILREQIKKK